MKIGIIGSGKIGSTTAKLFVDAGHEVEIANSRGPDSLAELVGELGDRAAAATTEEAARFGELVLVAIPLVAYDDLPADAFEGKIVVDANNYYPERDGRIDELDSDRTTSSELLASHLAGATVTKAFNTMNFRTLADQGGTGLAMFVAGDDAEAKRLVSGLIEEIGFVAVDTGSLADGGRRQQPGTSVFNQPMDAEAAHRALEG